MNWHLLMTVVTVKDGERALLTRSGMVERVLGPGRHRLFDPRRELTAEVFKVVRAEFPAERYLVLGKSRGEQGAKRAVADIVASLDRDSILREARSAILARLRG